MIYLVSCIFINSFLIIIFRLFPQYGIQTFQAIVANYFVASLLGYSLTGFNYNSFSSTDNTWLIPSFLLGLLFVSLFYLIAETTQIFGISVSSVANKMSVAIPVTAAVLLYDEKLSAVKITGIILALAAVFLVSFKNDKNQLLKVEGWRKVLPIILFIGCGVIDALINYLQNRYVTSKLTNEFILSTSFACAGITGLCSMLILIFKGSIRLHTRSIFTGLLLGIPNFFSMYLIMKTLESGFMKASEFFPVNNMSIVTLCTLISVVVFKEKLTKLNRIGILISLAAIYMLAFL